MICVLDYEFEFIYKLDIREVLVFYVVVFCKNCLVEMFYIGEGSNFN